MEVNARLQVEHPVTEAVDRARPGQAPAARRRRRAAGGRAAARRTRPRHRGAAERRGPGARLRCPPRGGSRCCGCPTGPGVRVDTGVAEGDAIPAEFDSMIAKVIAWGRDRDEALARLRLRARARPSSSSRAARPTRASCSSCSTGPSCAPATSTRPGWTGCTLQGEIVARAPRRRRGPAGGDRDQRGRDGHRPRALLRVRPPRPPAGRRGDRRASSSCAIAARPTGSRSARSAPGRYRVAVDGAADRASSIERARRATSGAWTLARHDVPHAGLARRAPTCSSRSTASRIASRATTAALVRNLGPGRRRRRSRSRRGDEVEAGDVVAVRREHEDGDLARRAVPRPRAAGPGRRRTSTSPPTRRCVRLEPLDGGAPAPRAGERVVAPPLGGRPADRAAALPREPASALEWLMLGYDIGAAEVDADRRRPARRVLRPAGLRPGAGPRRAPPAAQSTPTCAR